MVESFSSPYPAKCTISSLLENSYSVGLFFLCWGKCKELREEEEEEE
ncbi:hypothetical protein Gotri_010722 [Gossypium trilobum]|uniref:Uncharacterized protein n=1 Tax=Gossypium trilobum TaxID=34281 RepID=A0A7J9ERC8_9ROSI|nr:hypothetical protein [Gossypium trilobum]